MTGGWFKAPSAAWPSILDRLPRPLTADEVAVDLAWLRDREGFDGVRVPGRVELGRRWGIPKHRISAILARAPDGRITGAGRADDGRITGAAAKENADNRKISGRITGAGRADDGRITGAGRADQSEPIKGNAASEYTESSNGTDVAFRQQTQTRPDTDIAAPAARVGSDLSGEAGRTGYPAAASAPTAHLTSAAARLATPPPTRCDPRAWHHCASRWSEILGRPHGMVPATGYGLLLAQAIEKMGSDRICARFDEATHDDYVRQLARSTATIAMLTGRMGQIIARLDAAASERARTRQRPPLVEVGEPLPPAPMSPQQAADLAWQEVQPLIARPRYESAPHRDGPRLHTDDAEHGRRADALRPLWRDWCYGEGDAVRADVARRWRETYAQAVAT